MKQQHNAGSGQQPVSSQAISIITNRLGVIEVAEFGDGMALEVAQGMRPKAASEKPGPDNYGACVVTARQGKIGIRTYGDEPAASVAEDLQLCRERRELVYIASPLSSSDEEEMDRRYHEACRLTAEMVEAGITAVSPVVHAYPMARHWKLGMGWRQWKDLDLALLRGSSCLVVATEVPGWDESVGVKAEIEAAQEWGIPIHRGVRVYIADHGNPEGRAPGSPLTEALGD